MENLSAHVYYKGEPGNPAGSDAPNSEPHRLHAKTSKSVKSCSSRGQVPGSCYSELQFDSALFKESFQSRRNVPLLQAAQIR
eukprot:scaffold231797_cov28-Prasinocladus_malaysianus.AAC.1